MAEIIINISACYEDVGWEGSYVSTAIQSDWIKKISDVRNPMSDNNLHAEEAFSLSVNECGTFYSKIVPNKADSRGGFIQVTVIVPVGYRVQNPDKVISTLNQVLAAMPKEVSDQDAFFEKNPEQINSVKDNIAHLPANVQLVEDYKFAVPSVEVTPSSKAAFHIYNNEEELTAWFKYPHQDEHEAYKTVYFIAPNVETGSSAIALSRTKPQIVYQVNNGGKTYYLKEGTCFDLPLETHMDMEPKVYNIKADGKNDPKGVYELENETIYMYEGRVDFHREVILQVLCPVSETKVDNLPDPSLTLILNEKTTPIELVQRTAVGEFPRLFEGKFDYELKKDKLYNFELDKNSYFTFEPQDRKVIDSGKWQLSLRFKKRDMRVEMVYNDKTVETNSTSAPQVEITDAETGSKLKYVEKNTKQTIFTCLANKQYSVNLKCQGTPYKMAQQEVSFNIDQDDPIVRVQLKNQPKALYIRLKQEEDDEVTLITTTNSLDADAKTYCGYKITKKNNRKLHGEEYNEAYKIDVVPAKFKTLFIVMSILTGVFLAATIALGVLFFFDNKKEVVVTEQTEAAKEEKGAPKQEVDEADTTALQNDSISNDSVQSAK